MYFSGFRLQKLTKYGATAAGLVGLIIGGAAYYMQVDNEQENEPVKTVSGLNTAKTQVIDVIDLVADEPDEKA